MKKVLALAAVSEAVTGLALLIVPSLVGQLLFGEELTGVADTGGARDRHRPDRTWASPAGQARRGSAC